MGVFCCATRGTGKSRMLGRLIAWQDFLREIPLVVLDPLGGTIDNLLDKIGRPPLEIRRELWKRVRYIDMFGQDGRVVPWPIFAEAKAGERFSERSQRFVDLIARVDPALRKAPILGFNTLSPIAQASGIVLCALGFGVTEMADLIADPGAWEGRLQALERTHPETAPAIAELRKLGQLPPKERENRIAALINKLSLVRFHPNFRAIFGARTPGINWETVFTQKQAVLIDFRHVQSAEHQKFCLLWVYNSFLTYLRERGHDHMDEPVSFIIDELTFLVGTAAQNDELLTADLNELIHRIARSHGVWLTLATQELFQLPEQIRQTVLSMGTVIFGQTSDRDAAKELAERYYRYDPYKVKKAWPIFGMDYTERARGEQVLLRVQTTEFTQAEQIDESSRIFLDRKQFHFLIGQSRREGELPTTLQPFTIEHVDPGEYPNRDTTRSLRSQLMRRDGGREDAICTEIDNRLRQGTASLLPSQTGLLSGDTGPAGTGIGPAPGAALPAGSHKTPARTERAPAQSDWATVAAGAAPAEQPGTELPRPRAAKSPSESTDTTRQLPANRPTGLPPSQSQSDWQTPLPPLQPPKRRRRPGLQDTGDADPPGS